MITAFYYLLRITPILGEVRGKELFYMYVSRNTSDTFVEFVENNLTEFEKAMIE